MESARAAPVAEAAKVTSIAEATISASVPVAAAVVPSAVEAGVPSAPSEGVEAPTKRACKRADPHVGVAEHRRIPIPACACDRACIVSSHLVVSFSHVLRTQAIPVVKLVLGAVFIKA